MSFGSTEGIGAISSSMSGEYPLQRTGQSDADRDIMTGSGSVWVNDGDNSYGVGGDLSWFSSDTLEPPPAGTDLTAEFDLYNELF
ncbi:MAG: hypothetical protein IJ877_00835 [Candidatus Gastranaerophilales bacterium]|nr:hypothetical protein [Candidatus Gastranaerophilales bacterium]